MGEDAYELAKNTNHMLTAEIEKWKSYTVSTGFEQSIK
jgi:hypothetical protein